MGKQLLQQVQTMHQVRTTSSLKRLLRSYLLKLTLIWPRKSRKSKERMWTDSHLRFHLLWKRSRQQLDLVIKVVKESACLPLVKSITIKKEMICLAEDLVPDQQANVHVVMQVRVRTRIKTTLVKRMWSTRRNWRRMLSVKMLGHRPIGAITCLSSRGKSRKKSCS